MVSLKHTHTHSLTRRMTFIWCISHTYVKQNIYYSDGGQRGGGRGLVSSSHWTDVVQQVQHLHSRENEL